MGGQMLGGGVIIVVAVLLWVVYLLPSWHSSMRYNASERNAVRLNQALRVLAETSETPEEIRVELSARDARAQQRLVRQLRAEEDRLRAERDRIALERKRMEVQAEVDRAREEAVLERERRRRELAVASERRRRELEALRSDPEVRRIRQTRARRIVRLVATSLALAGIIAMVFGVAALMQGGAGWWLAPGSVTTLAALQTLTRMAAVTRRARRPVAHEAAPVVQAAPRRRSAPQRLVEPEDRRWTPRALPAPLTTVSGSRAALALAGARAQEALRAAAREEALRTPATPAPAATPAPVPITAARQGERSPYARMGFVDDAEIEAHVRDLLARRAAG